METYIAYFDETGDDGVSTSSSEQFILTCIYMSTDNWQSNFNKIKSLRKTMKEKYGFHASEEMHTKDFLSDKDPYRKYKFSKDQRIEIIKAFALTIAELELKIINTIIDKTEFTDQNYKVLENAFKYSIQRIDNDSSGKWNYIIITDKGRIEPMRKTARAIRAFNPIQSKYSYGFRNQPIENLIEDIMEKDSKESYFIQICDFISYFVHLYFKSIIKNKNLPNRIGRLIDASLIKSVMATLKKADKFNLKANKNSAYGLVIYPK